MLPRAQPRPTWVLAKRLHPCCWLRALGCLWHTLCPAPPCLHLGWLRVPLVPPEHPRAVPALVAGLGWRPSPTTAGSCRCPCRRSSTGWGRRMRSCRRSCPCEGTSCWCSRRRRRTRYVPLRLAVPHPHRHSRFPEHKSLTQQAAPQRLQLVEQERAPQPQPQPQSAVNGLWGTLLLPSSFPLHCRNVSLLTPLCISSEGWVLSSGSVSLMSPFGFVVRLGTG